LLIYSYLSHTQQFMNKLIRFLSSLTAATILSICPATFALGADVSDVDFNRAVTLCNEGTSLARRGELEKAAQAFQQAIQLNPNEADFYFNLAKALNDQGKYPAAAVALEKGLKLSPNDQLAWSDLGSTYLTLGKIRESIVALEHAVKLGPNTNAAKYASGTLVQVRTMTADNPNAPDYIGMAIATRFLRWEKMPVAVFLKEGTGVKGYQPAFDELLRRAFKTWEEGTNGVVAFVFVSDPAKAQISCEWTADRSKFSTKHVGGTTKCFHRGHALVEARILLCTEDEKDSVISPEQNRITTCLHETGHALGIDLHSSNPTDIMFGFPDSGKLSERDKKTMIRFYSDKSLYGRQPRTD